MAMMTDTFDDTLVWRMDESSVVRDSGGSVT